MDNLEKEMSSDTPELAADKDPKTVVKAAVFLIQKGIKDQVFSVSLLLAILYYESHSDYFSALKSFHQFFLLTLKDGYAIFYWVVSFSGFR